jgi:hypothetical protein
MLEPGTLVVGQTLIPAVMPVFSCSLEPQKTALVLAREAIEELRAANPEPIQSNVISKYVSPWNSHQLNPKFLPLCEVVLEVARTVSRSYLSANFDSINVDYFVKDCWGIIYEEADYTLRHNHFPSDLSCAIYLEAAPDCAPIVFENGLAVNPQEGLLVMFPGILHHEVPKTPGRRVVVSMNLFKTFGIIR